MKSSTAGNIVNSHEKGDIVNQGEKGDIINQHSILRNPLNDNVICTNEPSKFPKKRLSFDLTSYSCDNYKCHSRRRGSIVSDGIFATQNNRRGSTGSVLKETTIKHKENEELRKALFSANRRSSLDSFNIQNQQRSLDRRNSLDTVNQQRSQKWARILSDGAID